MKTPRVPFKNKLTENAIEEIRRPQLEKPGDYVAFGEFAAESYHQREDFLKDEYKRSTIKRDDWADWLYKINKGTTGNLKKDVLEYRSFKAGVDSYNLRRQQQKSGTPKRTPRQQRAKKISFSPTQGATGTTDPLITPENTLKQPAIGYIRGIIDYGELVNYAATNFEDRADLTIAGHEERTNNFRDWAKMVYLAYRRLNEIPPDDEHDFRIYVDDVINNLKPKSGHGYSDNAVTCPGNILSDISRLEVLVGGARAGNNSMEIINEASDICRRLFQGGIMDIRTYRTLIDELAETHRDNYGYYSD